MGFSNWFMTEITTPTLSTVDQSGAKIGEEATKILLQEIKLKDQAVFQKLEVDTRLIVRESS